MNLKTQIEKPSDKFYAVIAVLVFLGIVSIILASC